MDLMAELEAVEAQMVAAHEDGMTDRLEDLWKKHEAILERMEAQGSKGVAQILLSCIDATWALEEEALNRKDWPAVNLASKKRLDFNFRFAAMLRNEKARTEARKALADRLELVEQLEAHLPGLKAREWGLYLRAKHFDLLFR